MCMWRVYSSEAELLCRILRTCNMLRNLSILQEEHIACQNIFDPETLLWSSSETGVENMKNLSLTFS